ncbi:MAG: metal-binding protein [Propionibacteriales bacterium]|nr:metal-binding protein [Propionibacteriales bacterium]
MAEQDARDEAASVEARPGRTWRLLGPNGSYDSPRPGTVGGHRRSKIYGTLDCAGAQRATARGGYVTNRVFFADEATAVATGYRPCWECLREKYHAWKANRAD